MNLKKNCAILFLVFIAAGLFSTGSFSVALAAESPTLAFSALSDVITLGDGLTLEWDIQNANYCTASGDWSGTKSASDGRHIEYFWVDEYSSAEYGEKVYKLECWNSLGESSGIKSASVLVSDPIAYIDQPSGDITVSRGSDFTFSGSADSDEGISRYAWMLNDCNAASAEFTQKTFSNSFDTAGEYYYYLNVFNDSDNKSLNCPRRKVTVVEEGSQPAVSLSASEHIARSGSKYVVPAGGTFKINWQTIDVASFDEWVAGEGGSLRSFRGMVGNKGLS